MLKCCVASGSHFGIEYLLLMLAFAFALSGIFLKSNNTRQGMKEAKCQHLHPHSTMHPDSETRNKFQNTVFNICFTYDKGRPRARRQVVRPD